MTHLEYLTTKIGPRGSTTGNESRASQYAFDHLKSLDLDPSLEPFTSPKTGWRQFFYASLLGTFAIFIGFLGGRAGSLIAGIISLVTTLSVVFELYFRRNILRWLVPKGKSQNVFVKIAARQDPLRRVLVLAHLDTHRTPWVFETPRRLIFFRLMSTLGTVSFGLLTILFLAIGIFAWQDLRWLAIPLLPIFLIVMAMTAQADRTVFTQGANDNASGAAIVLSLSDQIVQSRLETTEVWLLLTGCEEVGSYGAQAFYQAHTGELSNICAINIDNVGGKGVGVCYATVEGMLIPYRPSSELLHLAERIRQERDDPGIYPMPYTTLHTDGTCLMTHGIPTITFIGLTPDGRLPNWHQVTDTIEEVEPETILAYDQFVMEMLHRLDQSILISTNSSQVEK
jgi:Peptidase family M28